MGREPRAAAPPAVPAAGPPRAAAAARWGAALRAERTALLLLLPVALWLALPTTPVVGDALVSGLAWAATAGLAAVRCGRAARRPGTARPAWRLLAVACAVWAVGVAGWTVTHVVASGAPPFPTPADVAFLTFPALAAAALLRMPGLPVSRTTRARMLLDGAVVTSSLLLVAWLAGMAELHADGAAAEAGRIAFTALDVLAAAVGLLVLDRVRPGSLPAVRLAATGVVVIVLSDVLYSAVASTTGYVAGGPVDLLWCAGFLLVAAAARHPGGAIDDPRPGSRLLAPLPAAVAGVALLSSGRLLTGLDLVLAGLVVALGAALTARQLLLAVDNASLHRALEGKVLDRTRQLQDALEQVRTSARTDPLTSLPNRDGFAEAVAEALTRTSSSARTAVVLLDLDRFQEVNDGLGHDVGDRVIVAAVARLTGALRSGQLLARLGGDEFGVLLTDLPPDADPVAVAERLVAAMRAPLDLGSTEVVVEASAGAATAAGPATRAETGLAVRDLLRDADTALHAAKADGGGTVRAFVPRMHEAVRRSLELQVDLRSALAARQLHVHYQPVVDLVADRVVGVEALVRWDHPERGAVPPLDFVAAAERSGLVVELERFVLDTACGQLARWRERSPGLTVAVNVSARHLRERDYLGTVVGTLSRHGLPPSALVLEVTESLLFHDDEHVRGVLDRLHTAGVGLALDDFGTGYSSLSRLVDYPFDTLKVDRSFVRGLDGPSGTAVLTATLAMARGLGMRVVAEGVETAAQLDFLCGSGCELAQGYLLSRPGPADVVGPVLGRRLLPAPRRSDDAVST